MGRRVVQKIFNAENKEGRRGRKTSDRKIRDRKIGILAVTDKQTVPFHTDFTEENEANEEDGKLTAEISRRKTSDRKIRDRKIGNLAVTEERTVPVHTGFTEENEVNEED